MYSWIVEIRRQAPVMVTGILLLVGFEMAKLAGLKADWFQMVYTLAIIFICVFLAYFALVGIFTFIAMDEDLLSQLVPGWKFRMVFQRASVLGVGLEIMMLFSSIDRFRNAHGTDIAYLLVSRTLAVIACLLLTIGICFAVRTLSNGLLRIAIAITAFCAVAIAGAVVAWHALFMGRLFAVGSAFDAIGVNYFSGPLPVTVLDLNRPTAGLWAAMFVNGIFVAIGLVLWSCAVHAGRKRMATQGRPA
jgi:hypothetical protein